MTASLKRFHYLSFINSRLHNSTVLSDRRRLPQPPNHLFSSQCGSLMEVFKAAFSEGSNDSDRIAIKADGKSYSYGQLTSSALTISKLFHNNDTKNGGETSKYEGFGGLQGARVGIVAKPSAEFVAGVLGTWFSGGVAVPLALSYPESELLYVMNNSDISALLSTEDHSEAMKTIAAKSDARFLLIPPVVNSTSESICNDPNPRAQQSPINLQETLETEPSERSEIVPPPPPPPESRSDISEPPDAEGHHRVHLDETSPELRDQPRTAVHAPPQSSAVPRV